MTQDNEAERLVKRLEQPPFGTETSERELMAQAAAMIHTQAARIAELEAEVREMALQAISDGSQAQEAYAAQRKAEAERDALIGAAFEAAAKACNDRGIAEQVNYGLGRETQNYYRARDAIRALTPADATAALARMIAEEFVRGVEEAAEIARKCVYYDSAGNGFEEEKFEEAILAAAKEAKP